MKKQTKRLVVLLLSICMLLSTFVGISAAEPSKAVKDAFSKMAEVCGLDHKGSIVLVDAGKESAYFTAELNYTRYDKGQSVVVLVQAVDANGNALEGYDIRVLLGETEGSKVSVSYQENGARYFAMMPAQCLIEQGEVILSTTKESNDEDGYTIKAKAELTMSDDFAIIAAVAKGNQKLLNFKFNCILEGSMFDHLTEADKNQITFADPKDIYILVDAEKTDKGVEVECVLDPKTLDRWEYMSAAEVRKELQTKLTMSVEHNVSEEVYEAMLNEDKEIFTYGCIEISYSSLNSSIPSIYVEKIVVPAEISGMIDLDVTLADPDDTGVSGNLNTTAHTAYMIGDAEGTFRPNANIARREVATIFYRLLLNKNVTVTKSFSDVEDGQWYTEPIGVLASMGILKGYGEDTFKPHDDIKRCELAAICVRFANVNIDGYTFDDVPADHWAADAISTCAALGWILGDGDGNFRPEDKITRAEAATLINRMLGRIPDEEAIDAGAGRTFSDVGNHWGRYQIAEASTDHGYTHNSNRTKETWK
ncbi:MAG: S-layer homology domain-containing protein [Ruminococcaceae bacterium]|nr:S-layer homology domain-containing protein [Oscillospiraceae bacterium]